MILITGATGLVGRHLVNRLMREAVPTRVLLPERQVRRPPWNMSDPQAPEILTGNVLDEEALFRAVSGCHAVIHLENAQWWGRRRDLERVELAGARALAAVARAARVGRIITLSHLGAAPSSAYTLHRAKGEVEDLLRNSGVAYTIIRSGIVFAPDDAFVNHVASMLRINPAFFLMPGHGEIVLHPIYIDDLVEAIYRSLDRIRLVDATVEIGGPEYLSLRDLILTVMRVTGMRRPIIGVPPYFLRWVTAVYSRVLPRSLMTGQWLDILAANRTAPLGSAYDHFGFQPRRFEDALLRYLPERAHLFESARASFRPRPRRF
ncbi:MAG: NAD(P)H-binding protein [Chloroflexi bacterium]|nr:NAD(P)H-binding protein [Chloroflexota bacterium]